MGTSEPFYALSSSDRSALLVILTAVSLLLVVLSIVAKVWMRRRASRPAFHDYVLLVGGALFFIQTISLFNACHSGLGRHQKDVEASSLELLHKVCSSTSNVYRYFVTQFSPLAPVRFVITSYSVVHLRQSINMSAHQVYQRPRADGACEQYNFWDNIGHLSTWLPCSSSPMSTAHPMAFLRR